MEKIELQELMPELSIRFNDFIASLNTYFSTGDNVRIISFLLLSLAIALFILLMAVIFVRHIISIVKGNRTSSGASGNEFNDFDDVFDLEDEDELERELQRELELAANEQQMQEEQELEHELRTKERMERDNIERTEREEKEKKERQKEAKKRLENEGYYQNKQYKEAGIDLDWKIGQKVEKSDNKVENIEALSMSYKQSSVELNNLMGLAIDMLGRGVDELKIAQTLNFKNQGMSDENEILKAIDSLKEFINLSILGKFAKLEAYNELPNEDQALYHLANGDPTLALALLENLMDSRIDKANMSSSEEKRQQIYAEVSKYACCFGSLAEMNDIMLATSSYELAIELQSTNVVAWGRLGDVYKKASSMPKAVWAYQNVLNFADSEIDINQIANANKNISEQLYAEGNSLQAAKLYNSSKQYYDSLGINRRLDKKEVEIIELIESNKETSLPEMINKLLSRERVI
ncbi:MAG: hypothetical protein E7004_01675 [Alphaproteobacteria bacterium]|nr:hypothetical protein [Alphaproteobacteria bacterium]